MFYHKGKNFTIRADSMNWILEYRFRGKKSSETKYYGSLCSLLNGVFELRYRECSDFEELAKELKNIKEELRTIFSLKIDFEKENK